jgi:hypothetical protein
VQAAAPVAPVRAAVEFIRGRDAGDLARFLAGMKAAEGSAYEPVEQDDEWIAHQREFQVLWSDFARQRFPAMREFERRELGAEAGRGRALFYPFGGPDALTALTLFPEAPVYVLVGLEPPGTLPRWSQFHLNSLRLPLKRIRGTVESLLRRSFFITAEMDRQLRGQVTDGVLVPMIVQLARRDCQILGYQFVSISAGGKVVARNPRERGVANPGVLVEFRRPGSERSQFLSYYSVNLATPRLSANRAFLDHLESLGPLNTFFKSTSYMPHNGAFGLLRDEVLARSSQVVQDDSGIPFRHFAASRWGVQLYGDYERPYGSFRNLVQQDLKRAYDQPGQARKLEFAIGYGFKRIPSNLLVARRKSG